MLHSKHSVFFTGWAMPGGKGLCDYARYPSYRAWKAAMLRRRPKGLRIKTAIGWSLGGQVLARAIADGVIRPHTAILTGAPFAFIDEKSDFANADSCAAFVASFAKRPAATRRRFIASVAQGCPDADAVAKELRPLPSKRYLSAWLRNALLPFDGATLRIPQYYKPKRVIILHGREDAVVRWPQAQEWLRVFPRATLHIVEKQGHAWPQSMLAERDCAYLSSAMI